MDMKKGTTTVALVCKNGIVFAADKQASAGSVVASKTQQKIFQIDDNIAVTIAGSLGDAQNLVSLLKAEIALRKIREKQLTTRAVASLTSSILHGSRAFPYIAWLVMGGYSGEPCAFSIDPFGGISEDVCIAMGSGMQVAYGVLEDQFTEGLDLEEGIDLAVRAIRSAINRDLATGGGIAVSIITLEGYREFLEEEVQKRLAKL